MIISDTSSETNITFSIPAKCPSSEPIECSLTRNDELKVINPSSLSTPDNKSIDQQEGLSPLLHCIGKGQFLRCLWSFLK
jgi:hypothetical protein